MGSTVEGTWRSLLTEQSVSVGAWTRRLPGFRRLRGDDEGVGALAHEGWPSRFSSERGGITSGGTLHPRAGHDGELLRRAERRPHRALGFGQRAAHRQSAVRIGGTCGVPRGRLKRCRDSHRRSRDARHDRARREAEESGRRPEQEGVAPTVHAAERATARALAPTRARARHVRPPRERCMDARGTPARGARGGKCRGAAKSEHRSKHGRESRAPGARGHRCEPERAETKAHVVEKVSCGLQTSVVRTGVAAASPHAMRSARPRRGCAPARVTTVAEKRGKPSSWRMTRHAR